VNFMGCIPFIFQRRALRAGRRVAQTVIRSAALRARR
jgi:hypothetical protein